MARARNGAEAWAAYKAARAASGAQSGQQSTQTEQTTQTARPRNGAEAWEAFKAEHPTPAVQAAGASASREESTANLLSSLGGASIRARTQPAVNLLEYAGAAQRQGSRQNTEADIVAATGLTDTLGGIDESAAIQAAIERTERELNALRGRNGTFDVSPYTPEENAAAEERIAELDKARNQLLAQQMDIAPTLGQRIGMAAGAIGSTMAGAPMVLADSFLQYLDNARAESRDEERTALLQQYNNLLGRINYLEHYRYPSVQEARATQEWQEANAQLEEVRAKLAGHEVNTPVSTGTTGMQLMQQAAELQEAALKGTSGAGRWIGENLISVGQNAAMLPLAAINPALPLAGMGLVSAGGKAAAVSSSGGDPGEAFVRGLLSGGIEMATEKIPLDSVLALARTGGGGVIKTLLKQAGMEATEEAVAYAAGYLADKAAGDPDTTFTLAELANAAASGGFSGLLMGGGATLAGQFLGGAQAGQETGGTGPVWALPGRTQETDGGTAAGTPAPQTLPALPQNAQAAISSHAEMQALPAVPAAQQIEQGIPQLQNNEISAEAAPGGQASLSGAAGTAVISAPDPVTRENVEGADAQEEREASVEHGQQEPQGLSLPTMDKTDTGIAQSQQAARSAPEWTERTAESYERQGDGVSDGGQGQLSGARAGEQIGSVVSGAKRASRASEQFRAASTRQDRINALRGEKVSSRDLGIPQGTDAKVVQIAPEDAWDDGMRATAARVYDETGMPVTYVIGGIQVRTPDGARLVRGVYSSSGIIIQADNMRYTTDQIADHEVFHDKAFQTPGLIAGIEARIVEQFGREEFARVVDTYMERLRGVIDIPEDALPEQIDAAARAVLEEIFADAYAGINAFGANAPQYAQTVEEVTAEHNAGRSRQNEAATARKRGPPRERYSYGGVNANGANLETLRQAQEMEQQGADMESIRRATGWHVGMDGKWRFEIDDSQMEYHRGGDAAFARNHPEYARYQELQRQFIEGTIEESGLAELRELNEIWGREYGRLNERVTRGNARLEDIIDHPALFRAYPQLRRVQVEFAEMEDGVRGSYSGAENKITLAADLRSAPEETLIHEIQHAIQRAEGFARGSNRQYWEDRLVNGGEIYSLGFGEAREALEQFEADPENAEALELKDRLEQAGELDDGLETYDSIWAEAEQRGLDGKINEYYDLRENYYTRRNKPGNSVPSELYHNTAGEIEARDAADRRNMSPWTRNMLAPDYGGPDTVFAGDGIDYAAETDSIKEQLRAHQDELLGMEPVATIQAPAGIKGWNMGQTRQWVINKLRPTGFQVDREGLGMIVFDEKRLNTSLNYLQPGDAEAVAYAALPRVLKRGVEISGHGNHKDRGYDTITIAAPVILNGERSNMAVVVKRTSRNFYKMHRVLTPDGALFVLPDEMANAEPTSGGGFTQGTTLRGLVTPPISSASGAEPTSSGGVTETGSLATPISSASGDSITQNHAESKGESRDEGPADIRFSVDEDGGRGYNTLVQREDVLLGEADETYTEGNRAIDFVYAVVPAEALVVSNDQYGAVNPAYPAELQPRDRSRTASQFQIQGMSQKLNPRLLADSPTAQNGAPIVRGDGAVVGGNARTQAIITAYEAGRAAEYERFIRERGKRYGLDTANMPKNPVLVRVARNVSDWTALAQELNAATTASYSTTEQAMTDAKKMDGILELIVPNDEGTINNEANRTFIQKFMEQVVPASERGSMTTATGMLSQAGLERAQYAIFAYAYGDPELLAKLSESLDNGAKNVTKALLDTAANAVAIRAGIEAGTIYDMKIVDNVLHGVRIYTEAKRRGETVQEYSDQLSMLEGYTGADVWIARFIEDNKRSGKQIRTMLNALYDQVQDYGDPRQETMFGGETHGLSETIGGAIRRYEEQTGRSIGCPDFGRYREDGEVAGGRPEAGGEIPLPGVDGADPGRGAGAGTDESRTESIPEAEPEGLTLPTLEEPAPTQEIPPATDYRQRLLDGLQGPRQEESSDLYRPEDMSDEDYNALNEKWKARKVPEPEAIDVEGAEITDTAAALEERAEAEKAVRLRNISREDFIGTPSLQKLGVKVENSVGIYDFIQSLIESDKAAKSVRRETRRAERRLDATDAERNFASGVAAGIYTEADIPPSMDADRVMELADYYWAERAVAADMIRAQRGDINRALSEKMEELFKDSDDFKPSKAVILNNRTPERNMLKIFGDERGAAINAAIFDPVAANEAERYRFRNRMHDEVRTFEDSRGRQSRLTREERAVVQLVIEGRAVGEMVAGMEMSEAIKNAAQNIRNGGDAADAANEFGLDFEQRRLAEKYSRWLQTQEMLESGKVDSVKVENAVRKYSELFDQFYEAINDFLVAHGYEPIGFIKGYAPHLQPEGNQTILNKSLQALGINTDVTRLPTSIAGLTADYKPNKRWNPYFLQRTGDATEYDIATAFESYVDYMSDVFYHTDDIMRVRQAANYFRRTYAPDEIREKLSWAEELRYGSMEQKANFLRDNDVISRSSAMTAADINQAMDDYVAKLYEDITKTTKYSEFVSYLDNYANILAGKQSMADRGWEYSSGRTVLNLGNRLVRAFGRAQVAGNLSSALNQAAQLPQITAELGVKYTTAAIRDIWSGKLRWGAWAESSDFLTGKNGIDYLVTDPADMVIDALFTPAQMMDGFISTIAVRGKYLKELSAGADHSQAMRAADAFGKAVMGSRMKGSRPLAYEAKNPVSQMLHVFQTEVVNQWEHLFQDLPRDFRKIEAERGRRVAAAALAGVIVKMLVSAFLLNRLDEELYGGTPAPFDILGLSANFIASGEGLATNEWLRTVIDNGWERLTGERLFGTDTEALGGEFDWSAAIEDTTYNVGNDIPFLRNAMGLLGLGDETLPMPDIYGAGESIVTAIKDDGLLSLETLAALGGAVAEFLPGGRQFSKTGQGLATALRGGSYRGFGDAARLQYPVEGDVWDILRAALFGQSALEETDAFYASGASGLSVNQTRLYEALVADGADGMEVYDAIQDYRAAGRDGDLTSYERGVQERNIIRALSLTDEQKLALYQGLTGADSRAEKFRALMDTGLTWDQVMDAYDKYAELNNNDALKAGEQASALAMWADGQGFTPEQAAAIKEQLMFYSIVPAEATRYAALTEAGLEADAAYALTSALSALTPLEGSGAVTDMQRYEAINAADLSEQEKIAAIGSVMGTEMTTEAGNPTQYAKMLDVIDSGLAVGDYLTLKSAGAVEDYLECIEAGASPTTALSMAQTITAAREELGGEATNLQMYRAAVNAADTPEDQMTALSTVMGESEYFKVETGYSHGVTPDLYVTARERIEEINTNSSVSQDEATEAIGSMLGLSDAERAVLWQLQNKSWKSTNNPFDPSVGEQVYQALQGGSGGAPGADADLPGLTLPGLEDE